MEGGQCVRRRHAHACMRCVEARRAADGGRRAAGGGAPFGRDPDGAVVAVVGALPGGGLGWGDSG